MRALLPLFLSIGVLGLCSAQDVEPGRSEGRSRATGRAQDPALPVAGGNPETQGAPELLPEATELRARAPLLPFPGGKSEPLATPPVSAEQLRENAKRLEQVRAIAMRSPRVIYLLEQARTALDIEARRNYLRAYYTAICTRMRWLEPSLAGTIAAFERAHIRQIGHDSDPKIPVPRSPLDGSGTKTAFRAAQTRGGKSSR